MSGCVHQKLVSSEHLYHIRDHQHLVNQMATTDISATIRYFDAKASTWSTHYRESRHFQTRLNTATAWTQENLADGHILDYGCGSGVLVGVLAAAGYKVTGVDASAAMIAAARATLESAGLGDAARLEIATDPFDGEYRHETYNAVICLGVLEYVEQWRRVLTNLGHLVKPHGLLILSFPNRTSVLRSVEGLVFRHPRACRALSLLPR